MKKQIALLNGADLELRSENGALRRRAQELEGLGRQLEEISRLRADLARSDALAEARRREVDEAIGHIDDLQKELQESKQANQTLHQDNKCLHDFALRIWEKLSLAQKKWMETRGRRGSAGEIWRQHLSSHAEGHPDETEARLECVLCSLRVACDEIVPELFGRVDGIDKAQAGVAGKLEGSALEDKMKVTETLLREAANIRRASSSRDVPARCGSAPDLGTTTCVAGGACQEQLLAKDKRIEDLEAQLLALTSSGAPSLAAELAAHDDDSVDHVASWASGRADNKDADSVADAADTVSTTTGGRLDGQVDGSQADSSEAPSEEGNGAAAAAARPLCTCFFADRGGENSFGHRAANVLFEFGILVGCDDRCPIHMERCPLEF